MLNERERNIKHYLQNIFTILNFRIIDLDIPEDEKQSIFDLVKSASLVIANENLFLGKEMDFFVQKVSVSEMLVLASSVFQVDMRMKDGDIELIDSGYEVNVDKNRFIDSLKVFMAKMLVDASFIRFSLDKESSTLMIEHDSNEDFVMKGYSISECFTVKEISRDKIVYLMAKEMFRLMGIDVFIGDGFVKLFFS